MKMCGPSGFPSPPPRITPRPAVLGMTKVCVTNGKEENMLADRGGDLAFPSGELLSLHIMSKLNCEQSSLMQSKSHSKKCKPFIFLYLKITLAAAEPAVAMATSACPGFHFVGLICSLSNNNTTSLIIKMSFCYFYHPYQD